MKEVKSPALKIKDAAKYLGIGIGTLRTRSDTGEIPCRKIGRQRYFIIKELDDWMRQLPAWAK